MRAVVFRTSGILVLLVAAASAYSLAGDGVDGGHVASEAARQGVGASIQPDDELLRLAKQAVAQRANEARSLWGVEVDPVAVTTGPVRWVRHRVRKDWIEFGDSVRVPDAFDTRNSSAVQKLSDLLDSRYAGDSLRKPILSIEATRLALATCNSALKIEVRALQPPYFNNDTGIRWFPDQGKLVFESIAVIDLSQNRCIRGIVDLHDGQVACTELACVVR